MVLGCMDTIIQLQPIEHAMLDIYPDEIWLRGSNHLGDEGTRDTMCDAHQRLAGIFLGVFEGLPQVAGLGEGRGAVWGFGVEFWLLAVGGEVCHPGFEGDVELEFEEVGLLVSS
jgi:hypothetical protein